MASRILGIDDDEGTLEMFDVLLRSEKYEVELRLYPVLQISEINDINPNLIILDIRFQNQNTGWQMLQLLKSQPNTMAIPIIICSAVVESTQDLNNYLITTHVKVINKPFEIIDLLSAVAQMLQDATLNSNQ